MSQQTQTSTTNDGEDATQGVQPEEVIQRTTSAKSLEQLVLNDQVFATFNCPAVIEGIDVSEFDGWWVRVKKGQYWNNDAGSFLTFNNETATWGVRRQEDEEDIIYASWGGDDGVLTGKLETDIALLEKQAEWLVVHKDEEGKEADTSIAVSAKMLSDIGPNDDDEVMILRSRVADLKQKNRAQAEQIASQGVQLREANRTVALLRDKRGDIETDLQKVDDYLGSVSKAGSEASLSTFVSADETKKSTLDNQKLLQTMTGKVAERNLRRTTSKQVVPLQSKFGSAVVDDEDEDEFDDFGGEDMTEFAVANKDDDDYEEVRELNFLKAEAYLSANKPLLKQKAKDRKKLEQIQDISLPDGKSKFFDSLLVLRKKITTVRALYNSYHNDIQIPDDRFDGLCEAFEKVEEMYVRIFGIGKTVCDLTNEVETTLTELKTQIKTHNHIVRTMEGDDIELRNEIAAMEANIALLEGKGVEKLTAEQQKEIADKKQEVEDLSFKTIDIDRNTQYPELSLCDFPVFQDMQIVIARASFICSQIAEQIELNKTTNDADNKLVEAQAIVDTYNAEEKAKQAELKAKKKRLKEAFQAKNSKKLKM